MKLLAKTKNIIFICPVCRKSKYVQVPVDIFAKSTTGTTPVMIPENVICEHKIHSYIDKNGAVRGYLQFEYNIMSMTAKIEQIKTKALSKYRNYFGRTNIEFILDSFSKHDLLHFFESCFMRYPIIFIENEPESDRFQLLYSLFASVHPILAEKILIYSMSEYDELIKDGNFDNYCILNVTHGLLLHSPVSLFESESVSFLMDRKLLENYILFNNAVKHLERYGDLVADLMPKAPKVIYKQLSKEKNKQPWLTQELVEMIFHRNEFIARSHTSMWKDDALLSESLKSLIPRQKILDEEGRKELEDMDQKLSKLKEGLWG
ncbi:hypothetical protein NEF87_000763 [Candidatus Lokiarchaeum ossiferum]|uniref:Uncharacterized protein n=1 Tax=Candidatus Lokiarchaeum ossiferum TaxID=2951803 RepID=A0ABY6HME9_9ARCH|nr:hypothetical protein NEF87_000763 [Candidatus Lokiarchaeum sp. B-35]